MKCIFKRKNDNVTSECKVRYSGLSNYYVENISAGGSLTLTDISLSFDGCHLNAGRTAVVIAVDEIVHVQLTTKICNLQHMIVTTPGATYDFAVYNSEMWVKHIKKAMTHK